MEKLVALLVAIIPDVPKDLVNWAWPTFNLKGVIDLFVANWPGQVDPAILGNQMVEGFAADVSALDPDGPEIALANIVLALIARSEIATGIPITMTKDQVAPFMVAFGERIVLEDWTPVTTTSGPTDTTPTT